MHSSTAGCDPVCVEHRIPQHGARMPLIPAIRAARASILVLRNACCTTTRPTRKFTHDQVLSECPASALVSHSKICSVRVPHLTKRALQDARRVVSSGVSVAFLLRLWRSLPLLLPDCLDLAALSTADVVRLVILPATEQHQ